MTAGRLPGRILVILCVLLIPAMIFFVSSPDLLPGARVSAQSDVETVDFSAPDDGEEAPAAEVSGTWIYAYGIYAAAGTLCAMAAIGVLGRTAGLKRGTAPLAAFLAAACGMLFSRLGFCVLYRVTGGSMTFSLWYRTASGGWCLTGLILGIAAGGLAAARIAGEPTARILDLLSCACLLPVAAVRLGERWFPGFDARFLQDGGEQALGPFAAAAALALFVLLAVMLAWKRTADGTAAMVFCVLFGAGMLVFESLRQDGFLKNTSFGPQQAAALILLLTGAGAAALRTKRKTAGKDKE